MSMEQVKTFIKKMKSDEAFSKRIMAIQDTDARFEAILEAGFDFTMEELSETGKEIGEAELEAVSGGACGGKMACMMFACLVIPKTYQH
jgi:predicted ribosomally synthesized peptide with nif11-like leader